MAEYIDREAVLEMLKQECSPMVFAYLADLVNDIPAADVRPVVKARFNLVDGYSITALGYDIKGLECSNCGATFIAQTWVKKFKFCPNCGADMREESK